MCSKSAFLVMRLVNYSRIFSRRSLQTYVHPVTGKKPPTLEEFDPFVDNFCILGTRLNPGEWQLGAYGKILPRLPEGTRCGKLVMGKYGLYSPAVRKLQEETLPKYEAGVRTEVITPNMELGFKILCVMFAISVIGTIHSCAMMLYGTVEEPLWPYSWWNKWRKQKKNVGEA